MTHLGGWAGLGWWSWSLGGGRDGGSGGGDLVLDSGELYSSLPRLAVEEQGKTGVRARRSKLVTAAFRGG